MLFEAMQKAGLNPARIQGQVKPEYVVNQKKQFNDDPTCRVIVCQQEAAARGHTLIGQTWARSVVARWCFLRHPYSFYWRAQMEDRNHRGSQDRDCVVYDLVCSPMDAKCIEILGKKKDLATSMDEISG